MIWTKLALVVAVVIDFVPCEADVDPLSAAPTRSADSDKPLTVHNETGKQEASMSSITSYYCYITSSPTCLQIGMDILLL